MPLRSYSRPPRPFASSLLQQLNATLSVVAMVAPLTGLLAQSSPDTIASARLIAQLQATAIASSPELASRRARLRAVRARADATGFPPPLAFSAGVSEAPNGNLDQGNLRMEVGRDLFTGLRLRAERAVVDADITAAEASLGAAERRVRLTVLREAIRAAGARLVAERLSAEDALLAGGEDGVRARFAVGQARYVDVLRLRTERLRVQTERAAALAEARVAAATLGGLLGRSGVPGPTREADDARLAAMLDTLATPSLADVWHRVLPDDGVTDAMLDSVIAIAGDVQLADADVARARAEGAVASAGRRPQVSALAGLQRIGQANNGPTLGPSIGVTVSLPFTASRANRRGAIADARRIIAVEASRVATLAAVRARVEAAAERYAAARERLAVFDAALLRGARDEREGALASYRSGGLSLLELVDFERALARAEIDRIRALVEAAAAWADLATGGATAEQPPFTNSGSGLEESSNAR